MSLNLPLDHVAIAVSDLESSVKFYTSLGLIFETKREVVESQKVQTAFAPIGEKSNLELLAATSPDSPIAKFIQDKGPGIHHLCFRVEDLEAKQAELEKLGYRFTAKAPFVGAHNCLVNFVHPKSSGGVLIELSQKLKIP
ncbi:MAG: methylmalonyl-CoA epimerase [Bacteriovoracaceae bacterium]|nr:methylmalonyl-CoA epimerase [Bacteriovoracaceae bacterium]